MKNIIPHTFNIGREERMIQKGHCSLVVWFTGLSGSGKSTLANIVEKKLFDLGIHTISLDGDNVRSGLNRNLGFTRKDRQENLRRIAEVARLFVDSGNVVIASFISPLKVDRDLIREIIGRDDFIEVFVNTPLEVCESRDPKGLYEKARAGEIKNFTGVNSPYENPRSPDIEVKTEMENVTDAAERIICFLKGKLEIKSDE